MRHVKTGSFTADLAVNNIRPEMRRWITRLVRDLYIYILVINVTAACVRGCAASVGLLVTEKEKKMGIQRIVKEMCVCGGGGGNY